MKIICSGIEVDGRKLTSVVVTLALLGYFNHAFAVTYDELNEQRAAVDLPLLTGNDQVDFQMLVEECNEGIEYSCFLAQQLQGAPKQQQSSPAPIPFDLNNPLEGLPILPDVGSPSPSRSPSPSNRYECEKCQRNLRDCWERQRGMKGAVTSSSMAATCSSWENTCARICNQ